MENKYQLSTGILECYPFYAVFHFNSDFYDHKEAEEFTKVIDSHYKGRKCVVVANRKMAKTVNPEVYGKGSSKSVVGIAIVSNNDRLKMMPLKSKDFLMVPLVILKLLRKLLIGRTR